MCSIFGMLGEYDPALAKRAFSTLAHRGVDSENVMAKHNLFLAHHHLKIASKSGTQPLQMHDMAILFNGELYNTHQLRQRHQINADDEVSIIAQLFVTLGVNFVHELDGMFAIAIIKNDECWLFRDPFGKKPLYFLHTTNRFCFASEIKALTSLQKSFKLNMDAVHHYFSFLAPVAPQTFYQGIEKVPAGAMVHVKSGDVKRSHYCNIFKQPLREVSLEAAVQNIEQRLDAAISKRHYEPQALLLSGGVDSALLSAKLPEGVVAYSLGFEGFEQYDETAFASLAAKHTRREHRHITMGLEDFELNVQRVLESFDEPINDPAAVPLMHLMQQVHQDGFRVVMSGEGSDEVFLGYRHYYEYLDIDKMRHLGRPAWLKKYFRANFSMSREWEWYKRIFEDDLLFRTSGEKFTDLQQNRLFRENVRDGQSRAALATLFAMYKDAQRDDMALWMSGLDLWHYQSEHFLTKLDRTSMRFSMEARAPYLDDALVQYVLGLNGALRADASMHKHLLKRIAASYLPDAIVQRKKRGFATPYLEWLLHSGEIKKIEALNERTGMFHRDVLARYIENGKKGRFKQHIWGLYLFSRWLESRI